MVYNSQWYMYFLHHSFINFSFSKHAKVLYRLILLFNPLSSFGKCIHLCSNIDMTDKEYVSWRHSRKYSNISLVAPLKFGNLMDECIYPTLYWACDYLSLLVLNHVHKRGPSWEGLTTACCSPYLISACWSNAMHCNLVDERHATPWHAIHIPEVTWVQ